MLTLGIISQEIAPLRQAIRVTMCGAFLPDNHYDDAIEM